MVLGDSECRGPSARYRYEASRQEDPDPRRWISVEPGWSHAHVYEPCLLRCGRGGLTEGIPAEQGRPERQQRGCPMVHAGPHDEPIP